MLSLSPLDLRRRLTALDTAMKLAFAAFFAFFLSMVLASPIPAHDILPLDRFSAANDFEQARADLRNYWLVEYPRQLRELDVAIEMTQREISSNKALFREYGPFNRFSTGNPFPITQRNLELCARSTELRLDQLRTERNNLMRFRGDKVRAFTARMVQARDRLQAIDAAIAASASGAEPLPEKTQSDQLSQ